MSVHTATTLAYVRTSAGVVKIDPEGTIPDDVDDAQLQRLVGAGVVAEIAAADPVPAPPASGKGRRSS